MTVIPYIRTGISSPFELIVCDGEGVQTVIQLNDMDMMQLHHQMAPHSATAFNRQKKRLLGAPQPALFGKRDD